MSICEIDEAHIIRKVIKVLHIYQCLSYPCIMYPIIFLSSIYMLIHKQSKYNFQFIISLCYGAQLENDLTHH